MALAVKGLINKEREAIMKSAIIITSLLNFAKRSVVQGFSPLQDKRYHSTITKQQDVNKRTPSSHPAFEREITSVSDLLKVLSDIHERQLPLLELPQQKGVIKTPPNYKVSLWFRGHANTGWDLSPSIFRGEPSVTHHRKSEGLFYLDERSALFNFTSVRPELKKHTLFDVLAIAQHHGLPTRLLDWSQSAVNALLFAVEDKANQDKDGEFFILNPFKLNYYTIGKYAVCRPEHPEVSLRAELAICKDYKDLATEKSQFSRFYSDNITKIFRI